MAKGRKKGRTQAIKKINSAPQVGSLFEQACQHYRSGDLLQAEQGYKAVLELNSKHYGSLLALAYMALEVGRYPLALQYAKQAVEVNHAEAEGHLVLGNILSELGLTDFAEAELVISQQLNPANNLTHNVLGLLYMRQGRTQEADDAFRQSIRLAPKNPVAYYNLTSNKQFASGDLDVELIESLRAHEPEYSANEKSVLHFAMGKVYHDCARYDEAFAEFKKANQQKRETFSYDIQDQEKLADGLIKSFDADARARLSGAGCLSDGPVFIIGMPRSGTTLIESHLCRHPDIASIGETPYIKNLALGIGQRSGSTVSYPDSLKLLSADVCAELGEEYIKLSRQFGVKSDRIIDKLPDNFLHVGFILSILPNAKIIHCFRDPIDNCLSIYQQNFSLGVSYSYDLKEIGLYYLLYRRMMAHWHKLFPNRIFDIDYQSTVTDTEGSLRELVDYCGLSWDEKCLGKLTADHVIKTASVWQARQPVYQTSLQRWRKYEKHLGELLEVLAPVLEES